MPAAGPERPTGTKVRPVLWAVAAVVALALGATVVRLAWPTSGRTPQADGPTPAISSPPSSAPATTGSPSPAAPTSPPPGLSVTVSIAVDGANPWEGPCPPDGVTTRFTGRVMVTGGTGPVTVTLRWETTDDRAGRLEPLTFDDRGPKDLGWGVSQTYNPGGTYDEMIKLVVTGPVQAASAPLPYTITCS